MPMVHLLYEKECPVNDKIKIVIPTVGQVLDDEDNYYETVSLLTAMPIDMMVQLDDMGIDFTTINEYDLFILLFSTLLERDTSLIFGDLNLRAFKLAVNEENGNVVLRDERRGITIDRAIQSKIADTLRTVLHLEKNIRKAANKESKEYMLSRARIKMRRAANRRRRSQLEDLIISMVNTEQFKYDFNSVRDLTIYQFNESAEQIVSKINYEHLMTGIYMGTIDPKKMSQDELNWLKHK